MNRMALGHILAGGFLALGAIHSWGNPTGGVVTSGSASINTVPGTVTINQASNIAIINWQSFSIGAGELTKFVQPSPTSAVLNRVLGGGISNINGTLSANGQVLLINGNGIVIGSSGVVNTNAFLASTRDITDDNFNSGNLVFTGSNSAGVQNSGTITVQGIGVALLGKTVDNEGTINAPNGTVALASGDNILINLSGDEHVFVSPSPTATSASTQTAVLNGGAISAASAELKAANGNLYALAINNAGTIRATAVSNQGGHIYLTTDAGMVQNNGTLSAKSGNNGGSVSIKGGSVWNRKTIDASGAIGGSVTVSSVNIQNDGTITVQGTQLAGGTVALTYSGNALGSVQGLINASGYAQGGSIQFLGTGTTSEAYLSLTLQVNATNGAAGSIGIDSPTLYLTGATLTANGSSQGGRIFLGEGDPETSASLPVAQTTYISLGTSVQADATSTGNGGYVVATGTGTSEFLGTAAAKGAGARGAAGTINIVLASSGGAGSGGDGTGGGSSGGGGDDSGSGGSTSSVTTTPRPTFEFVDPDPGSGNGFGRPFTGLFNLSSNTTLVTSPGDSFGGADAGAVYLFSDTTGALLATLRGSHPGDSVGSTVQVLTGSNFAIDTPTWNNKTGAITFGNGVNGFTAGGGAISSTNSLIGSNAGDAIGSGGSVSFLDGNYLFLSPSWNGNAGAVTWVNPAVGVVGVVGPTNSLVGANPGDAIGSGGIHQLDNGDNYLVLSPLWNNGEGAITNGHDGTGIQGTVSAANSLVGAFSGDAVGTPGSIVDTSFGYYLVATSTYDHGAGAVTWNSSVSGATGAISSLNSLVGSASGDEIGSGGITLLYDNHNYIVSSPHWNDETGAVTLGNNSTGVSGDVSSTNSLVGANAGDEAGSGGITVLYGSGKYVVSSPNDNDQAGAVTLVSDTTGITGAISPSNSLVGMNSGDQIGSGGITTLDDGNILVLSPSYGNNAGAVTWDKVSAGTVGTVSASNSLVGLNPGDNIGSGGIIQLSDGNNYLVLSPAWGGGKGAITNGSDNRGIAGAVSATNSLVGGSTSDHVGSAGSVTDPFVGYYLVSTPNGYDGSGAITWSSDSSATVGVLSDLNSLVGTPGSQVGSGGITILDNGDYVVSSPNWNGGLGAVTWGSASTGVHGAIAPSNSLTGANPGDHIGSGGIIQLDNASNYLVLSPHWSSGRGAVTNASSSMAITGAVSGGNSLVGTFLGDGVGSSGSVITTYSDYYLVATSAYDGGAGAVTWNSDSAGALGAVSASNSLVGDSSGDHLGSGGVDILDNGNYLVLSPDWASHTGAATWGNLASGVAGEVTQSNSLIGQTPGDQIGSGGIQSLSNGAFLLLSPSFGGNAGAVTWVDEFAGKFGQVGFSNSLVGANPGDQIGSGGIDLLAHGKYLVLSPQFGHTEGAITWGSDSTGASGYVSNTNSLVGAASGDAVGSPGSILQEPDYYLVDTPNWGQGAGAVTWNSYLGGTTGVISNTNSLVGSARGDQIGSGGITVLANGNYVVVSPDWHNQTGAVTVGADATGITGVVGETNTIFNSLVGGANGDQLGSGGITLLDNGNYLILSPDFAGDKGAVTFASETGDLVGKVTSGNSLIGATAGDAIGSGGITSLANGNYLVLSPEFAGGAGAVTFGNEAGGVAGIVGATNSLVGLNSSDHIGSGGIIFLPNDNYLVQSPLFHGSAGAVTWGSGTTGVAGVVSSSNSIVGGGPDSGEKYSGLTADGTDYLVSFTTDTSEGGDGRVMAGSVDGASSTPDASPKKDLFVEAAVEQVEASQFNIVTSASDFFISNPAALPLDPVSVDVETGGAVNSGHGHNLAQGSSTTTAPGPRRLVTPGNGIWNIFGGVVHAAAPPAFIVHALQINLSPVVYAQLNQILFGHQ